MANLNPQFGTELGKVRPVVIIQANSLNVRHPSTIVCPITSNVTEGAYPLRLTINKKESGLEKRLDIVVDQMRPIDSSRLRKKVGTLANESLEKLKEQIKLVLDLA